MKSAEERARAAKEHISLKERDRLLDQVKQGYEERLAAVTKIANDNADSCDALAREIRRQRAQLAEKDAEIERLRGMCEVASSMLDSQLDETERVSTQLSARDAELLRMREGLEHVHRIRAITFNPGQPSDGKWADHWFRTMHEITERTKPMLAALSSTPHSEALAAAVKGMEEAIRSVVKTLGWYQEVHQGPEHEFKHAVFVEVPHELETALDAYEKARRGE